MKKNKVSLCVAVVLALFSVQCADTNLAPVLTDSVVTVTAGDDPETQLDVSWKAAVDDFTLQTSIKYKVVYSTSANISSVVDAEENGTLAVDFTGALLSTSISDLTPGSYSVNVIAMDTEENKTAYSATTVSTADNTAPVVSNSVLTLDRGTDGNTQIDVSWNAATDNVTDQSEVQYQVVYSILNNISSIADAQANGTVAVDYTEALTATTISSLNAGTQYFVNVIAKDASENKTPYASSSLTTTCFLADTLITMSDRTMKRIDAVVAGDRVLSFDENGEITESLVGYTIAHQVKSYLHVVTDFGTIGVTANHPFFANPGFRPIGELRGGDTLFALTPASKNALTSYRIRSLETVNEESTVYNLHVSEGPPTYFADHFAVHNK